VVLISRTGTPQLGATVKVIKKYLTGSNFLRLPLQTTPGSRGCLTVGKLRYPQECGRIKRFWWQSLTFQEHHSTVFIAHGGCIEGVGDAW